MPELPEVEVLVRHLRPALLGQTIRGVSVHRERVLRPTKPRELSDRLIGAKFLRLERRAKFLVFTLRRRGESFQLLGHLGMTGRMFLVEAGTPLPKHAAVVLDLGAQWFVFQDTRYFGRFNLDASVLTKLGPEPLGSRFKVGEFREALRRSRQPIKVKLLDQSVIAGIGNIYASEALHLAGISPRLPACQLTAPQALRLYRGIRAVLGEAIRRGSTVPLDFAGKGKKDKLFYYGRAKNAKGSYEERLRVYDREGTPCLQCGEKIQRITQAARSTFFCETCQH